MQVFQVRTVLTLMAAAVLAASTTFALAQSGQEHAAHHPEGASAPVSGKAVATKPKAAAPAASAASGGMGMGMAGAHTKQMHDEMHKPGGMHDRMHGKDGSTMGAMPAASAASR
ncbi:hypothetical protein [Rhizobacter sp. SG703]|uniref:hypothetical protein n=1 Tax=Rhizobacter sp. SG703 TaxID=2587140 RepID=UPI001445EC59|nr:hypothetical protein [Rhizobacter sp. SG703]NKI92246.1 hypothetical protein [Rhizobacter sp. SG703]